MTTLLRVLVGVFALIIAVHTVLASVALYREIKADIARSR